MVARSMLQTAFVGASAVATSEYAIVGTGGCDGAMTDCVDDKTSEQTLQQIEIQPDGKMVPVEFPYFTGGMPVWLASSDNVGLTPSSSSSKCVFASLADKDQILPLVNNVPGNPVANLAVATGGAAPVHMTVTANGKFLLSANYHGPDDATTSDGAGVSSMAILSDGIGCGLELRHFVPHAGSGTIPSRQGGAHVHSVYASRDGNFAYVCDLGQDLIFTYRVDDEGKLTEVSRAKTNPGAGPRHLAEHPTLDFVYSVQEMEMTVSAWKRDASGELQLRQTLSLVPDGASGQGSKAAEILILPDGSALYASNRGALNSMTVFSVADDGSIKQSQQIEAPRYPRGVAFAHDATLLLVASQQDTTIESFKVGAGGNLTSTGYLLAEGIPNHPATFQVFPADSGYAPPVAKGKCCYGFPGATNWEGCSSATACPSNPSCELLSNCEGICRGTWCNTEAVV